nr:MAG: capsid protein [Cressdnaviricota sp.]
MRHLVKHAKKQLQRFNPYGVLSAKNIKRAYDFGKSLRQRKRVTPGPSAPVGRVGKYSKRKSKWGRHSTGTVDGQHADTSQCFMRTKVGRPQKIKKSLGQYKYLHEVTAVATGGEGLQQPFVFNSFCTFPQLLGTTSATRNTLLNWGENLYDLNPYRNISGSAVFPASVVANAVPDVMYIDKITGTLEIMNLENVVNTCELYWMLCKKNTNSAPDVVWADLLTAEQLGSTPATLAANTAVTTVTAGQPNQQFVGTTPLRIRGYTQIWKPLKIQKFILQAGDVKKINFHIGYNKLIRQINIKEFTGTNYLAGYTVTPMLVMRGGVVGTFFMPQATVSELTYARTKLGYLSNYTVHVRGLSADRLQTTQYFAGAVASVGGTNPEEFFNDVDVATVQTSV